LFQIGEFSFVLARVGLKAQAIDENIYSFILCISVISMMATPFASSLTAPLYKLSKRIFKYEPLLTENIPPEGLKDHVVIAGGGRVGQHIAHVLRQLGVSFVIVELNHQRLIECKADGLPVIFGDMAQPVVIDVARVREAKLLLITIPSIVAALSIVNHVRRLKPDLQVVARAEGVEQSKALYGQGVYMVVLPEMEAGLEIARQALLSLKMPVTVIQEYTDAVRQRLYGPIYKAHADYGLITQLDSVKSLLEVSWVEITPTSPLHGKTIAQMAIRTRTGASVVGVIHEGSFLTNPNAEHCFAGGDIVAVVGNTQEREAFRDLAEGAALASGQICDVSPAPLGQTES